MGSEDDLNRWESYEKAVKVQEVGLVDIRVGLDEVSL